MDLLGIKCDDRHVMGSQYMSAFFSLWKVGPLERVTSWVATGLLYQRLRARTNEPQTGVRSQGTPGKSALNGSKAGAERSVLGEYCLESL